MMAIGLRVDLLHVTNLCWSHKLTARDKYCDMKFRVEKSRKLNLLCLLLL